jgi:lipopolysaccharide biosynthesis glycosyltransferase
MTSEHPRPVLTIVSNADAKFFPGLAVALASATAAATGRYDYQILVIDGGIDPDALTNLDTHIATIGHSRGIRATVTPLAVDQGLLAALPERRGSRMFYAKLVLPVILAHLESIVYLDADVLCFDGVESVQPVTDSQSYLLAGALDYFNTIEKDCPWLDQLLPHERTLPYINSGVMWMNLKGLREINFTEKSIAARAAVPDARHADQAVFNFLCRGKSFILPDSLNHRTALGSNRPLIEGNLHLNIHYIGSPKPWLGDAKTSNWLAHRLWHQADAALFHKPTPVESPPPHNLSKVRKRAVLYRFFNPPRAAHYRSDLKSLNDPGSILTKAANYWESVTQNLNA